MADKRKVLITILIAIIVVMAAVLVYIFLIGPAFTGFVTQKQNIGYSVGYQQAFLDIMQQTITCQQVPLTYGNQTINIIAVGCLPQQQPQQ